MRQSHATKHVRRFGELDVVVPNDLHAVAPRVEEIEKSTWQRLDARCYQSVADGVLIVDHQSKMTGLVGGLGTARLQREELIAQIDEGRRFALAAKFKVKQSTIECQGLVDITDFESDMVETQGACFPCFLTYGSPNLSPDYVLI
jgi:hypothetical protein